MKDRREDAWVGELYEEGADYMKILRGIVADLIAEGAIPGQRGHYSFRSRDGVKEIRTAWALIKDLRSSIQEAVAARFVEHQRLRRYHLVGPDPERKHGEPHMKVRPPYAAMQKRGATPEAVRDLSTEELCAYLPEGVARAILNHLEAAA